ncbi:carbamoyltransferase C-terminal domain-containing protein [Prochlorococcus marinus]|uniref:carbamoyltransferase C-terminal domain-containing protein n=1 Tax=Prochlorococcus marinus TaxID=1219 RepID=UPI0012DAE888|nr:carbamoyltransferase C-terminal domain-containing protein [Prochlorococcus marinus]
MGAKIIGVDSAACLLDFDNKRIYAVTNDRLTRLKKDNVDCKEALEWIDNKRKSPAEINFSSPFNCFSSRTQLLENANSSLDYSIIERGVRSLYKPRYRSELLPFNSKRHRLMRLLLLSKPSFLRSWLVRENKYKNFQSGSSFASECHHSIARLIGKILPIKLKRDIACIEFHDHHLCHSYSAYYLSSFSSSDCIIVTLDELGDGVFLTMSKFKDGHFAGFLTREPSPRLYIGREGKGYLSSVPSVYSNFTEALGLVRSSDEGKVEALAAYGKVCKTLKNKLEKAFRVNTLNNSNSAKSILDIDIDSIKDLYDIDFLKGHIKRIGRKDFAATVQSWLEDFMTTYIKTVFNLHNIDPLHTSIALAGGATANVIMNLKIFENIKPEKMFITPPMGDEGTALGSAILSAYNRGEDLTWISKEGKMPYFGPEIIDSDVHKILSRPELSNLYYVRYDREEELAEKIANDLIDLRIVCIARGAAEFGPRALGNRSILAIPTSTELRDHLNANVKKRPLYQPFCPAVLEEDRKELFEESFCHKHMAIAFRMKPEYSKVYPSACHIDNTARPQFVTKDDNMIIYFLLKKVKEHIGHGILINTSFNLHGRSMVTSASDAIDDYLDCNIYSMALGNFYISRRA